MKGTIYEIYVAPTSKDMMVQVPEVRLVPCRGIEGDRYFNELGTFSEMLRGKPFVELTLIEREVVDWFNETLGQSHGYGDFRRSIVTEGINLNDLVDKRFYIGDAEAIGIRLCEPCPHLAETVNPLVLPNLVGKGGLRAQITKGAVVNKGSFVGVR